MKNKIFKLTAFALIAVIALFVFVGCSDVMDVLTMPNDISGATSPDDSLISEEGEYSDKENVALYLHNFGKLPQNYITKKEAESEGWESHKGNLHEILPGKSIGGDHFGNHEGLLPEEKGLSYHECDIDYESGGRNGKRIIYSNQGDIYYTDDHYKTFTKIY